MKFHEKTLELNITREILNLCDSWHWFLSDIPLWRYWRPRYRLPFIKYPTSTAAGFHITTEGKNDPTGEEGGGFDVRIKTGKGGHLLFIQYKKGELELNSPNPNSIFNNAPHEHFKFELNSTATNQHFTLRNLSNNIGGEEGNAVVYALPLIEDMDDLEQHAGNLLRKTKFISIKDIDRQAKLKNTPFVKNQSHYFRVGRNDMDRCEINFFFIPFEGKDRTIEILTDVLTLGFEKNLKNFTKQLSKYYKSFKGRLDAEIINYDLNQAFIEYQRYLLHYFEVNPNKLNVFTALNDSINSNIIYKEFEEYSNTKRDIEIINSVFKSLNTYSGYIDSFYINKYGKIETELPNYKPSLLQKSANNEFLEIGFNEDTNRQVLEGVGYISI